MGIDQIIVYIVLPILVAYVGYNERDKSSMKHTINKTLDQDKTEHLIDLKNRPMEIMQQEAAKDIKECNTKLDKIEDMIRQLQSK